MTVTATVVDIDPDTDRDAWLAWRRNGVGASDVAGILGISHWSSPWSVWADKLGLLPEQEPSEVMEAGHFLERAIGPWFSHRTGLTIVGEQVCYERDDSVARCSVDLLVGGHDGADALTQIKTAGFGKKWPQIPEYYQAQGQWEMHVSGLDVEYFAVLMGRRLDVHELKRDQADIDFLIDRVDRFWTEHVVTGDPPATDGSEATLRALSAVYPQPEPGKAVELDPDARGAFYRWLDAKEDAKTAKAIVDAAAAELQAAIGDAEEATIDGERRLSWREQTRKSYTVEESTFRVLREVKPRKTNAKGQAA